MKINQKTKLALINSGIAGALVFLGSFSSGVITSKGIVAGVSAMLIIFLTKMRDHFNKIKGKKGMKGGYFNFI